MGVRKGEDHANSVLTWEKVRAIRAATEVDDYTLAREHGVERTTIRLVRLNAVWKDENYEPRPSPLRRGRPPKKREPAKE